MANGAFWSLSGSVISRGLALVSSIIIARFLGASGYGEFGLVQSTIGMFGSFAGLGLGMTATKYISQYRDIDKVKAGKILGLTLLVASIASAIVSIILFVFSPWLAAKTIAAPHLSAILRIGSFYLFFLSITGLQNGILAGFEAFKAIAVRSVIAGVSTFPLMVGGVYFFGLKGALWGLVGSSLINIILNYFAIKKISLKNNIKINIIDSSSEKSILNEFALPAFLGGVMVGPVNWICNTILINQINGYSEMGIYNAANQWMLIILFVPSSLSAIILPMLTNLNQDSNSFKYSRMLKYNIILNILITTIISLGVIVFSPIIMSTYGTSFSGGRSVLIILAITAILVSYNGVIGQAIASKGKMWIGFILNLMWALVLVLFTYWFVKNGGGAFGFAEANFYAYLFLSVATTLILKFYSRE
jgi:O-antigen/teichoic acid export membrane protein